MQALLFIGALVLLGSGSRSSSSSTTPVNVPPPPKEKDAGDVIVDVVTTVVDVVDRYTAWLNGKK